MKAKELKDKKVGDIAKLVHDKKEELRAVRSNISGSKTRNVKEIATLRKDVARMLTELNARK
jgi:ribosomal protein L29